MVGHLINCLEILMTDLIERSAGIVCRVGVIPFVVGGGYEGKTEALDTAVQAGAVALQEMFDHPVVTRFNSDRMSGGAFLRTNDDINSFAGNAEIQIGACLFDLEKMKRQDADFARRYPREEPVDLEAEFLATCERLGLDPNGSNEQIKYKAGIHRAYVRDPDAPGLFGEDDRDSCYHRFDTFDEAVAFVRMHAVADPRTVTERLRRQVAERLATKVKGTEELLAPLDKKSLTAICWRIPYTYRPQHFGFKNPKENKATLREIILKAVRAGDYTFNLADTKPRWS